MAQFALVGAGAVAAYAGVQCFFTYQFVYQATRYVLRFDYGFDWRHQSNNKTLVVAAGSVGAALTGVGVFASFKYALDRILLAKRPDASRLLDKLSAADNAREPLTLRRAWLLLGPRTATRATLGTFGRSHGAQLLSVALAAGWACMLAPAAQAAAEACVVHRGSPLPRPQRFSPSELKAMEGPARPVRQDPFVRGRRASPED